MTNKLFPTEIGIPAQYRIDEPIDQRHFLCDGEIVKWEGSQRAVLSPICVSSASGVTQKIIGSYPLLEAQHALAVQEAAYAAYDHGRGPGQPCPFKSVSGMLRHLRFV